jgi:hypothetical protein
MPRMSNVMTFGQILTSIGACLKEVQSITRREGSLMKITGMPKWDRESSYQ